MSKPKLLCKDKGWSLSGMTALVTGGTRGIGYAIVEELAEFGAAVHICSRNQEDIDKCLKEWESKGYSVTGSACDVLSHNQRENLMETISNAGTLIYKEAKDGTAEDMSTIMGTNFESAYHLSQLAYPLLKASGCGSIVNISSTLGVKSSSSVSVYAASKGAMNQVSKNLAFEWAKDNIRVNVVAPGPVKTVLLEYFMNVSKGKDVNNKASDTPVEYRVEEPKEISALVAFLCLPAASYITGQIVFADGGSTL